MATLSDLIRDLGAYGGSFVDDVGPAGVLGPVGNAVAAGRRFVGDVRGAPRRPSLLEETVSGVGQDILDFGVRPAASRASGLLPASFEDLAAIPTPAPPPTRPAGTRAPRPSAAVGADGLRGEDFQDVSSAPISTALDPASEAQEVQARQGVMSRAFNMRPPAVDPWGNSSGRPLTQGEEAANAQGRRFLDEKFRRPMAEIERQDLQPSDKELYEQALLQGKLGDLSTPQVPVMSEGEDSPGAFRQEDGVFVNEAPPLPFGEQRRMAADPKAQAQGTMARQANVILGLSKLREKFDAEVDAFRQSGGRQGRSPEDASEAYKAAEKQAAMLVQALGGGRDFADFVRPMTQAEAEAEMMREAARSRQAGAAR